jgi:branched-chain amino acid transport system ATP-binding protein
VLKIDKVSSGYGNIRILREASLEVQQKELVALIGANGAGKTTLLRTISGLIRPTSGSIRFVDREITVMKSSEIVTLGISHCPEERKIWPFMSVLENLEVGAHTRRDKLEMKKDIERVFNFFPQLSSRRRQLGGSLSGGEQQMLAIGRALMSRPKLLLFDEPSLGLSPILVEEVVKIIQEIHTQGVTVLLVEQNAFLALKISNRGYVMENGTVSLEGRSEDLLNNTRVKEAYLGGTKCFAKPV